DGVHGIAAALGVGEFLRGGSECVGGERGFSHRGGGWYAVRPPPATGSAPDAPGKRRSTVPRCAPGVFWQPLGTDRGRWWLMDYMGAVVDEGLAMTTHTHRVCHPPGGPRSAPAKLPWRTAHPPSASRTTVTVSV